MSVFPQVRDYIESRDHRIMRRVHHWAPPQWVRLWMIGATRGGDGWLWYAVGLFILAFGGEERFVAVGSSTLAALAGVVFFLWAKRFTGRRRPCALEPHCWSTLLPPDQFSFPSGHTITAFAIITPLLAFYPELSLELGFCAVSIAASRILLGMHFLSDVVAGAAIGTLLGTISVSLLN
ncbi:phosphatase PAP2 family protein [Bryobacter aggregatus]|uniref:phosphatase PAP2 family protein n=1 Tax=Bryobacter aggregatus TaxID=360054 RepID=UPI0004E27D6E|nr:phosphatase PAP2 family protein [Bryobacter aggregatus]